MLIESDVYVMLHADQFIEEIIVVECSLIEGSLFQTRIAVYSCWILLGSDNFGVRTDTQVSWCCLLRFGLCFYYFFLAIPMVLFLYGYSSFSQAQFRPFELISCMFEVQEGNLLGGGHAG